MTNLEQQSNELLWTAYNLMLEIHDNARLGSTLDKDARIDRHIANAEKQLAAIKRSRMAQDCTYPYCPHDAPNQCNGGSKEAKVTQEVRV